MLPRRGRLNPVARRLLLAALGQRIRVAQSWEMWPRFADVRDGESLVRSVLEGVLGRTGAQWQPWQVDEALQDLRERLVILFALYFDPSRGLTFASYATWKLDRFTIDRFFRSELGRSGGKIALTTGSRSFSEMTEAERDRVEAASFAEIDLDFEMAVTSIDHDRLSPAARGVLFTVARCVAEEGIPASEAALRIGKGPKEVRQDLKRLRMELVA